MIKTKRIIKSLPRDITVLYRLIIITRYIQWRELGGRKNIDLTPEMSAVYSIIFYTYSITNISIEKINHTYTSTLNKSYHHYSTKIYINRALIYL